MGACGAPMENNTWTLANLSSRVQIDIKRVRCPHSFDIDLNTGRKIPHLQAPMYYFVYYINTGLLS